MAGARPDAFEGGGGTSDTAGPGCPFAATLGDTAAAPSEPSHATWTSEAEARLERIPSFIRSMARRSIERFAEGKGYPAITEAVMDEARVVFGM
jgi:proto-chlorophyllide reductase subunit